MSKDTSGRSKLNLGREAMTTEAERDCKHGQLARSCNVCELEAEVERQAMEIERLKSTPPDQREDLRCVIADLMRQCQESDALLRQALEALEKTRAFHQQDWSSEEITPKLTRDTIAAIKQHLGEV